MSTYENISMNDYFNEDGHYFFTLKLYLSRVFQWSIILRSNGG